MIARNKNLAGLSLALLLATALPGFAAGSPLGAKKKDVVSGKKLTPAQSALIDKALAREKEIIKVVKERAPLVETYIQNMRTDPVMRQVPDSDEHFLGRVEFGKVIGDNEFKEGPKAGAKKAGFFHNSFGFLSGLSGSLHLQYQADGFVRMILIDSTGGFDRQHYSFYFVRNDFLGTIPTAVFDVQPVKNEAGRFFGRIWVETGNGNIVRYNGDLAGSEENYKEFYHFDSWRTNVQPNLWLPTSVYIEESDPKSQTSTLKFKAINHVWGYVLKVPTGTTEQTSIEIPTAVDNSQDATDVGPLEAQRKFRQQAEDNVIERLFQAGLLDAPSEFDKTLEALANNILAYNNIAVTSPIRVRTLLTEPLESLAVGNTIILSKSLIDTTAVVSSDGAQQMGNLNTLLAFQIAHILSGHQLDTKYAFQDRLMFPDNSSFKRIPMHHTAADNAEAAKKTMELLNAKELADSGKYFGLYLQQLQDRIKSLRALNEPMIGDGLVKSDTDQTFWLASLMPKADKLDVKNLKQQGAVPLSSLLRFDPWTDQLIVMHSAFEPILSASDKMPFEVTPVYIKLGYYKNPADAAPATPVAPAPDANAPAAAPPAASAAPDPNPPAASTAAGNPAAPATPTAPATPPPDPSPTASSRN
jgi:hypothetical protein